MFFRREKPRELGFDDRLAALKAQGMAVSKKGNGKAAVMRKGCAAVLREDSGKAVVERAGVVVGREIGELTHGGYQMFFTTPSGGKEPALAEQLRELHEFLEDLREGLGHDSFYNTSLGTTNQRHLYDRVRGRDPKPRHDHH
ncbi:MAG: hypothetical protein K7J46_01570 [Bryobacter sp.]|jgi:hypothetical protein|nr:hypothetical protein [Bryobacter sp. CoA8 C33]